MGLRLLYFIYYEVLLSYYFLKASKMGTLPRLIDAANSENSVAFVIRAAAWMAWITCVQK